MQYTQSFADELLRQAQHSFSYAHDAVHPELVEGPGDVPTTYADATALERDFVLHPKSPSAKASASSPSGIKSITNKMIKLCLH